MAAGMGRTSAKVAIRLQTARSTSDGLITTLPRYVPVLHLHGRIGWYRRIAGDGAFASAACSTPSLTHNRGNGIPIIALPESGEAPAQTRSLSRFGASSLRRLAGRAGFSCSVIP